MLSTLSTNTQHCTEHGDSSRDPFGGRREQSPHLSVPSAHRENTEKGKGKKKKKEELPPTPVPGFSLTRTASLLLNCSLGKGKKEAQKAARKPTVHWLPSTPGERAPSAAVTWQAHLTLTQHLAGRHLLSISPTKC